MPTIKLEVSSEVYIIWQNFLNITFSNQQKKNNKLGELIILNFLYQTNIKNLSQKKEIIKSLYNLKQNNLKKNNSPRQQLSKEQKRILPMFNENYYIDLEEIARVLAITKIAAKNQVKLWLKEKFLTKGLKQKGLSTYILSDKWQLLNLDANRPSLNTTRILSYTKFVKNINQNNE